MSDYEIKTKDCMLCGNPNDWINMKLCHKCSDQWRSSPEWLINQGEDMWTEARYAQMKDFVRRVRRETCKDVFYCRPYDYESPKDCYGCARYAAKAVDIDCRKCFHYSNEQRQCSDLALSQWTQNTCKNYVPRSCGNCGNDKNDKCVAGQWNTVCTNGNYPAWQPRAAKEAVKPTCGACQDWAVDPSMDEPKRDPRYHGEWGRCKHGGRNQSDCDNNIEDCFEPRAAEPPKNQEGKCQSCKYEHNNARKEPCASCARQFMKDYTSPHWQPKLPCGQSTPCGFTPCPQPDCGSSPLIHKIYKICIICGEKVDDTYNFFCKTHEPPFYEYCKKKGYDMDRWGKGWILYGYAAGERAKVEQTPHKDCIRWNLQHNKCSVFTNKNCEGCVNFQAKSCAFCGHFHAEQKQERPQYVGYCDAIHPPTPYTIGNPGAFSFLWCERFGYGNKFTPRTHFCKDCAHFHAEPKAGYPGYCDDVTYCGVYGQNKAAIFPVDYGRAHDCPKFTPRAALEQTCGTCLQFHEVNYPACKSGGFDGVCGGIYVKKDDHCIRTPSEWQPRAAPQEYIHLNPTPLIVDDGLHGYLEEERKVVPKSAPACARCGATTTEEWWAVPIIKNEAQVCHKCFHELRLSGGTYRQDKARETAAGHPWFIDKKNTIEKLLTNSDPKDWIVIENKEEVRIMFKCEACGYADETRKKVQYCPACGVAVEKNDVIEFAARGGGKTTLANQIRMDQIEIAQLKAALAEKEAELRCEKALSVTNGDAAIRWKGIVDDREAEIAHLQIKIEDEHWQECRRNIKLNNRQPKVPRRCRRCMKRSSIEWPCSHYITETGKCQFDLLDKQDRENRQKCGKRNHCPHVDGLCRGKDCGNHEEPPRPLWQLKLHYYQVQWREERKEERERKQDRAQKERAYMERYIKEHEATP